MDHHNSKIAKKITQKITKKFTKKFGSKVINIQCFYRKNGLNTVNKNVHLRFLLKAALLEEQLNNKESDYAPVIETC